LQRDVVGEFSVFVCQRERDVAGQGIKAFRKGRCADGRHFGNDLHGWIIGQVRFVVLVVFTGRGEFAIDLHGTFVFHPVIDGVAFDETSRVKHIKNAFKISQLFGLLGFSAGWPGFGCPIGTIVPFGDPEWALGGIVPGLEVVVPVLRCQTSPIGVHRDKIDPDGGCIAKADVTGYP